MDSISCVGHFCSYAIGCFNRVTCIPLSYLLLSFPKNKFVCDYPIPVKSMSFVPFYPWEWIPVTSEPVYLNLG